MITQLAAIGEKALKDIEGANTLEDLERFRVTILGKKGALTDVLKGLGSVGPEERPKVGAAANEWKAKLEVALNAKSAILEKAALDLQLQKERIDVTLPARKLHRGSLHPITTTTRRIVQIFSRMGFDIQTGPEVETEFFNFEAVNIPADHPAREMHDTFFMGPGVVLRTHTSSVQMRVLQESSWPVRILCPGAVFRCDDDATHLPMFHQVEGLWVDRGVKMSDLKGSLEFFAKEMFGSDVKIRLRPSYFPFVEPGCEVDVSCFMCGGKEDHCKICKGSGWLEILGAGMVHPKLFQTAGFEKKNAPKDLTGFAFGMGVERIAMLTHEIPDLRLMVQGDVRFLTQF